MAKKKELTFEERVTLMLNYHLNDSQLQNDAIMQIVGELNEYVHYLRCEYFAKCEELIPKLISNGKKAIVDNMHGYYPEYPLSIFFLIPILKAMQETMYQAKIIKI